MEVSASTHGIPSVDDPRPFKAVPDAVSLLEGGIRVVQTSSFTADMLDVQARHVKCAALRGSVPASHRRTLPPSKRTCVPVAHLAHADHVAHRVWPAGRPAVQFPLTAQHRLASTSMTAGCHRTFASSARPFAHVFTQSHSVSPPFDLIRSVAKYPSGPNVRAWFCPCHTSNRVMSDPRGIGWKQAMGVVSSLFAVSTATWAWPASCPGPARRSSKPSPC